MTTHPCGYCVHERGAAWVIRVIYRMDLELSEHQSRKSKSAKAPGSTLIEIKKFKKRREDRERERRSVL